MTCIVGLVHNGVTYIGADSLGSDGHSKMVRKDRKVFKMRDTDRAVLGYTTSFRMGQLLMYADGLLKTDTFTDINHRYLVTSFIPRVLDLFESNNYGGDRNNGKYGGTFLLGYKDKLYKIYDDYQVAESVVQYDACGCGEEFALGSLYSTANLQMSPQERVLQALRASTEFSVGVQAPYYIMNTANDEVLVFDK